MALDVEFASIGRFLHHMRIHLTALAITGRPSARVLPSICPPIRFPLRENLHDGLFHMTGNAVTLDNEATQGMGLASSSSNEEANPVANNRPSRNPTFPVSPRRNMCFLVNLGILFFLIGCFCIRNNCAYPELILQNDMSVPSDRAVDEALLDEDDDGQFRNDGKRGDEGQIGNRVQAGDGGQGGTRLTGQGGSGQGGGGENGTAYPEWMAELIAFMRAKNATVQPRGDVDRVMPVDLRAAYEPLSDGECAPQERRVVATDNRNQPQLDRHEPEDNAGQRGHDHRNTRRMADSGDIARAGWDRRGSHQADYGSRDTSDRQQRYRHQGGSHRPRHSYSRSPLRRRNSDNNNNNNGQTSGMGGVVFSFGETTQALGRAAAATRTCSVVLRQQAPGMSLLLGYTADALTRAKTNFIDNGGF